VYLYSSTRCIDINLRRWFLLKELGMLVEWRQPKICRSRTVFIVLPLSYVCNFVNVWWCVDVINIYVDLYIVAFGTHICQSELAWRCCQWCDTFNGFRVLAALLHGTLVVGVNQTLWHWTQGHPYLAGRLSRWALAHILVHFLNWTDYMHASVHIHYINICIANIGFELDSDLKSVALDCTSRLENTGCCLAVLFCAVFLCYHHKNLLFMFISSHLDYCIFLVMAALWNRGAIIFLPCGYYFSIFLSFFSSPNLRGQRLDVYHTSTHGVALVRI